ncbi:NifB/NifX family molybdenum-iron cluster-binding protein [Thermoanaerobacter siderophilus]|uniref:Uncharacterized protein n=1 Tax=Thermoanaerobacter siderophilus SR4 TaxID=880478 RepID=I9AFZ8_9THEO|nr:NifB/NifX family molybdenum-iron cluster-binding protein [Thermoanaerobacter siderophilus]EIW00927.1 hypothetical protein ThesiDRAFT1_2062 [Thermoanaerobacter siderophilus SR4]
MIIAFASKNHLGLNSDVGSSIVSSEYFTVAEIENRKLKKVKNVENPFFKEEKINAQKFVDFIKNTNAQKVVISALDNADIENELLLNDIEVIKNVNGRIADILKEL